MKYISTILPKKEIDILKWKNWKLNNRNQDIEIKIEMSKSRYLNKDLKARYQNWVSFLLLEINNIFLRKTSKTKIWSLVWNLINLYRRRLGLSKVNDDVTFSLWKLKFPSLHTSTTLRPSKRVCYCTGKWTFLSLHHLTFKWSKSPKDFSTMTSLNE